MKEPEPIHPYGSAADKYQRLTSRELWNLLQARDSRIQGLVNENKSLKGQLTMAKYEKDTAIEMLRHEVARHVETKFEKESTPDMSDEEKFTTRNQCLINICRERAGDHYALNHHQGKEHHYYAVEHVANYVYYTDHQSFRDFDRDVQSFNDHEGFMKSSREVIADYKNFLVKSREGLPPTFVTEVSDSSDGDSSMSD